MAGLGETLLDAYDLIGTASYLEAARQIREGLRLYALPRPGGLAFPGEQLYRLSSDLGTGSAGVALFLHRLEHAAEHPGSRNFMIDGLLPARAARPEPRSIPMLAADRP